MKKTYHLANKTMSGSCRVFPSRDSSLRELRGSPSKRVTHSWFALLTLLLSFVVFNSVSALTYQNDTDVDFTINPTISVSLSGDLLINDLVPGSYADSNIITVNAATNASHGYYLAATVGDSNSSSSNHNTNLTHSTNSNYTFTKLSSNAANLSDFSDNQWGYSYSTDGGTNWVSGSQGSTDTGYNGLPLDGNDSGATGITLIDTTSPVANNSVKFKIGAKASNTQPAGTYTNTINFYAVTYKTPVTIADAVYMQDVEECPSTLPTEKTYTLKDSRDEQEYTVAKLKDGKCWMTENLNLAGNTALSSANTDVTSDYIGNFSTSNNLTKSGNTIVLPVSSTTGFDTNNYSYVYNTGNNTNNCTDPGCYSYYSWDAATLGSGRSISTNNANAEQSICPKGWKLPSTYDGSGVAVEDTDFRALMIAYDGSNSIQNYDSSTTPTGATMYGNIGPDSTPNFLLAGYYSNGSFDSGGSAGRYWSSTSSSSTNSARYLFFTQSRVSSADTYYRYVGRSVRCLLK